MNYHQIFIHILFRLAAEREKYLAPLREEVDEILECDGWSKDGLSKMRKVDSFIREILRYNSLSSSASYMPLPGSMTTD